MGGFDVERFVSLSKAVDTSDIDWDEAGRIGLREEELRILQFLSDTESHTLLYLQDLLSGGAAREPEVMAFLSCWVYEEMHHGRALDRMMRACGREPNAYADTSAKISFREAITGTFSRAAAAASPHFRALHMAWGAVNEATAAATYTALARHTKNGPLATLVTRLARDERKHFSFYAHQAERRLEEGGWAVQKFSEWTMRRFWAPPGSGVGDVRTLDLMATYLFDDARGMKDIASVDASIRKLPGLGSFDLVAKWVADAKDRVARGGGIETLTPVTQIRSAEIPSSSEDVAAAE